MRTEHIEGMPSLKRMSACTAGKIIGDGSVVFDNICTDSGEAGPRSLFVAFKGERVDGHDHIESALKNGASCVLAEDESKIGKNVNAFLTESCVRALMDMARAHQRKKPCTKIAVTGSVGKTTTKNFIASVLNESGSTYGTRGNFNSVIGMPLSVMEISRGHKNAVIEMGMSAPSEISEMSKTLEPDMAVITNIGSSHLERLGTRENILKAKLEIKDGMKPGGKIYLNIDNEFLLAVCGKLRKKYEVRTIGVENPKASVYAFNIRGEPKGTFFDVDTGGGYIRDLFFPLPGKHNVYAALFAVVIALDLSESEDKIRKGLAHYGGASMRQSISHAGGYTILDDCYNSAPESVMAAVDLLTGLGVAGRRVAVLGDMAELGEESAKLHRATGKYVSERGVDKLFCIGRYGGEIALGALKAGMPNDRIFVLGEKYDPCETATYICDRTMSEDVVLFKASRVMRFDGLVRAVKDKIGV